MVDSCYPMAAVMWWRVKKSGLLAMTLLVLLCNAGTQVSSVQIIFPAHLPETDHVELVQEVVVPEIKAIEQERAQVEVVQVQRYPELNLSSLNDNAAQIVVYLYNHGLSGEAISGIMANIDRETGGTYDPSTINVIGAVGLCQWLGSRAQALYQCENWNTVNGQLDYLLFELETTESKVDLSGSAYECGYNFARDFERPGISSAYADRGRLAEEIYAAVF